MRFLGMKAPVLLFAALSLVGCDEPRPVAPYLPVIITQFAADSPNLKLGESTVVRWSVANYDRAHVRIEASSGPPIGDVPLIGTAIWTPTAVGIHTLTIIAFDYLGTPVSRVIVITVRAA
jgi:hypothetical protein